MKIYIDNDELYPYYEASSIPEYAHQTGYEITDKEWQEYKTALSLFRKWQTKLRELAIVKQTLVAKKPLA